MSGNLRDLIVSIDFDDIDVRELLRVDSALDEIEDQLRGMGLEMAGASEEIDGFGRDGSHAAHRVSSALDEVGDEAREAAEELTLLGAIAHAALNGIDNDADHAAHKMDDMGHHGEMSAKKIALLGAAWTTAFLAAEAAGAPLLLLVGGLAASLTAAGLAAGAFGAVAIPTLTGMFKTQQQIDTIQKKINEADTAKERTAAQKELAAAMAGVSKEELGALQALQDFKSFFSGFKDQFDDSVFTSFGISLHILQGILTGLAPTINNTAAVVQSLLTSLDQDISSGGMKEFFDWLALNGADALQNFATIAGNVISGVLDMMMAFSPVGESIEENIVSLTDKFAAWADGLSSNPAFQNFVDYALQNGPTLWDTLGNIWDTIKNIVIAAAPLGTDVLNALQWLTDKTAEWSPNLQTAVDFIQKIVDGVQNNWPAVRETVIGVGVAVGSFVAIMKGLEIIGVINTLIGAYRAGTLMATLAQYGLNTAMLLNPMTWVVAGIAALIAIGVLLYRNWDTIKAKAGELWATIKEKMGGIKDAVTEKLQPVIDFFGRLYDKWESFKKSISNFKMPSIHLPSWLGGGGGADGSHATGLSRVPFDGYKAILHKDEAVLTAKQSDALRAAGILDTSGSRPDVNAGSDVAPTVNGKGGGVVFSPSVTIEVNGASGDAKEIGRQAAAAARSEIEKLFDKLGMAY